MSTRAIVVHATNLLARGFIAAAGDRYADDGTPTNALFASVRALVRALAFKEPDVAVAVIDDVPIVEPSALSTQAERWPELLESLGFHIVKVANPADQVASYAKAALDAGHDVVVVGSDKRLAQLVDDRTWWYDAYKDVRYTPELVRKRFEVAPAHVAGWLALTGDDDTLGGITGIGKKGATVLVETFGSIDAAISQAPQVEGRTGKMLRASLDEAKIEVARAKLDGSRSLPKPLWELGYRPPSAATRNDILIGLGFDELLVAMDDVELDVIVCDDEASVARALQALSAPGEEPIAAQVLTEDPTPVRGALVGLALARGDGRAFYFPFVGKGNTLSGPAALARWLEDPAHTLVGHDLKGTVVALARKGIQVRGVVGDSACASHLTEPSNLAPHDLPLVARKVLRRALPEDDSLRGVGRYRKSFDKVAVPAAAKFACVRADTALSLWKALQPNVESTLMAEYLELSDTLVRMETHGICCDAEDLARSGDDFTAIAQQLETEIFELAGKPFNLGSTKQLGAVLFEDLELPILKRTKTGWSTATEALERIEHAHPIVPLVIRSRQLQRLKDSWVTALINSIDSDGRVRSSVHPARSFSGRLVNSNPDLGRVPGKTPEMARIRHAFCAPPGKLLLSVDYSQLGLYVLAHLTKDPALTEPLRERADMHTLTAAAVLCRPPEAIGVDERQTGKVVNFATFAGQGASALALQLGVPAAEAKVLIERFDQRYAQVRRFQDQQFALAQERGYIQTIAGRRWPIAGLASLDQQLRAYAERLARRATHEGSVADVSRRGLLHADRALRQAGLSAVPLLQVHDEVLFEVPEAELKQAAEVAAHAMRYAFALEVPLRVGCKAGPNWAELTPVTNSP